jgi:23S rRNA C2498 (ribose-2'-O)-methylase RlmM
MIASQLFPAPVQFRRRKNWPHIAMHGIPRYRFPMVGPTRSSLRLSRYRDVLAP